MKKIYLLSFLLMSSVFVIKASEANDTTIASLNEIIDTETKSQNDYYYSTSLQDTWSKNTFFNICFNKTELSSKELLTTTDIENATKFKNDWGLGIQWGHTYNFNKRAYGDVVFIGLNYTWMDFNINKYKDCSNKPDTSSTSQKVTDVPWHNEKTVLGYGMSLGPALTLYPFTSLHNKNANKIRIQAYFHVGYGVSLAIIKNGHEKNVNDLGHGLYTSFGASLTWSFIGVGYEWRNDNNLKYKCLTKSYDSSKIKMKEKSSRVYLQFRF